MLKVDETIRQALELGKALIAKKIPSATGDTVKSLEVKETKLLVRKFFTTLTTGRGPSKRGSKGSRVLFDKIKRWAKARGIPEEAVGPITRKLHKEGDRVFRGKKKGVDFDPEINKVKQEIERNLPIVFEQEFVSIFDSIKR